MRITHLLVAVAFVVVLPVGGAAQAPVQSFDQLSTVVAPGTTVVVKTADGHSATGKVVSLTGSALEIDRQLWFFRVKRVSYPEVAVRRVEKRDSTWDGALIGVGIGVAVTTIRCAAASGNPDDWSCLYWRVVGPVVGGAIGEVIDAGIRRSLYIAQSRVQLTPVGGAGRLGVVAAVRQLP